MVCVYRLPRKRSPSGEGRQPGELGRLNSCAANDQKHEQPSQTPGSIALLQPDVNRSTSVFDRVLLLLVEWSCLQYTHSRHLLRLIASAELLPVCGGDSRIRRYPEGTSVCLGLVQLVGFEHEVLVSLHDIRHCNSWDSRVSF